MFSGNSLNLNFTNLDTTESLATLRAYDTSAIPLGKLVTVLGSNVFNDQGGGDYTWDPNSQLVDDNVSIIRPNNLTVGRWLRIVTPGQVVNSLGNSIVTAPSQAAVGQALLTKPDRYPTNPASVVLSNYDTHYAGWLNRFFDSTNNHLYPTRGLGVTNGGCPDTTLPDANGNKLSPWMWCQGICQLYERWKYTGLTADLNRITGSWAYFQTQFTFTQMTATTWGSNPTSGLSDDNAWFANALRMIHQATGDATALQILIEYVAGTAHTYQDTRATNPTVNYGVSTPGGILLQRNSLGYQYDHAQGYGDISGSHEIMLAYAALYISQQVTTTSLTAALKAGFLQLATDTWTWAFNRLRFAGTSQAIQGIYVSALNLAPGNSPGSQRSTDVAPTTKRGATAFADHGTLAMGCLSDYFYQVTGTAQYLNEFNSISNAYPTLTIGFGRVWNGLPCLVNTQDPWTDGFWHGEFTRRLETRYPAPGQYSTYKLAILGASKVISSQSHNGIISPNWGPPEVGGNVGCYTWEQDSMAGYSGTGGGGQASGRQLMAASSSMGVIGSGAQLASAELVLGSGMNPGGVEILTGEMAASLAGLTSQAINPMRELGTSLNGYRSNYDSADGRYQEFINEHEIRRIDGGGSTTFGTHSFTNGILWGTANSPNYGLGVDSGGNPYIQWDSGGTAMTYSHNLTRYEWRIGNTLLMTLDGSGNLNVRGAVTANKGTGE